ncbi:MAG: rRNA ((966)-N(2))-methyltransferase [Pseudomonadota bacterium]
MKPEAGKIRIIGGSWRGRKLTVPPIAGLRPTPDRLRETLFNWLMPSLNGASCLDLFAGSGALGFEAISRGAQLAVLIEQNSFIAQHLQQQLQNFPAAPISIINQNALQFLSQQPTPFDLVFLDPPFHQHLLNPTLELLQKGWLAARAFVYVEIEKNGSFNIPDKWELFRQQHSRHTQSFLFYSGG